MALVNLLHGHGEVRRSCSVSYLNVCGGRMFSCVIGVLCVSAASPMIKSHTGMKHFSVK